MTVALEIRRRLSERADRAGLVLWLLMHAEPANPFLFRKLGSLLQTGFLSEQQEQSLRGVKQRSETRLSRSNGERPPTNRKPARPRGVGDAGMRRSIEILIGTTAMMLAFAAFHFLVLR